MCRITLRLPANRIVTAEETMDIRHIKYLIHAVDRKSLSGAARDLGVSVQAVSKSIAELEREVGGKLLSRDKRGVRPTELGVTFYRSALPVLEAMGALEKKIGLQPDENELQLVLAIPEFDKCARVCSNIEGMISRLIGVKSTVVVGKGTRALDDMRNGLIDGVISIGAVHDEDAVCLPCVNAQPAVILASDHPLAKQPHVTIEDLSSYPVSRDPEIDNHGDSFIDLYLTHGLNSPVRIVHGGKELRSLLVNEMGYRFSVYTPHFKELFTAMHVKPIAPHDTYKLPVCLVGPKRDRQSPGFVRLYSFIASNLLLAAQTIQSTIDAD